MYSMNNKEVIYDDNWRDFFLFQLLSICQCVFPLFVFFRTSQVGVCALKFRTYLPHLLFYVPMRDPLYLTMVVSLVVVVR